MSPSMAIQINPNFDTILNGFVMRKVKNFDIISGKKEGERMDKTEAWNYAIGMVRMAGLEPTKDFKKCIEKEIRGEATMNDLKNHLDQKYKTK